MKLSHLITGLIISIWTFGFAYKADAATTFFPSEPHTPAYVYNTSPQIYGISIANSSAANYLLNVLQEPLADGNFNFSDTQTIRDWFLNDQNAVFGYAWSKRFGWLDFSHGVFDSRPQFATANGKQILKGYIWSKYVGWIQLSSTGFNPTQSQNGTNWGVFLKDAATFDGFAWGQNIGWISFKNVKYNSTTGKFYGFACHASATSNEVACNNNDDKIYFAFTGNWDAIDTVSTGTNPAAWGVSKNMAAINDTSNSGASCELLSESCEWGAGWPYDLTSFTDATNLNIQLKMNSRFSTEAFLGDHNLSVKMTDKFGRTSGGGAKKYKVLIWPDCKGVALSSCKPDAPNLARTLNPTSAIADTSAEIKLTSTLTYGWYDLKIDGITINSLMLDDTFTNTVRLNQLSATKNHNAVYFDNKLWETGADQTAFSFIAPTANNKFEVKITSAAPTGTNDKLSLDSDILMIGLKEASKSSFEYSKTGLAQSFTFNPALTAEITDSPSIALVKDQPTEFTVTLKNNSATQALKEIDLYSMFEDDLPNVLSVALKAKATGNYSTAYADELGLISSNLSNHEINPNGTAWDNSTKILTTNLNAGDSQNLTFSITPKLVIGDTFDTEGAIFSNQLAYKIGNAASYTEHEGDFTTNFGEGGGEAPSFPSCNNLNASLKADKYSGQSPLVSKLTTTIEPATGTPPVYVFDCDWGDISGISGGKFTCTYKNAGTYTANVQVTKGLSTAFATTNIDVTATSNVCNRCSKTYKYTRAKFKSTDTACKTVVPDDESINYSQDCTCKDGTQEYSSVFTQACAPTLIPTLTANPSSGTAPSLVSYLTTNVGGTVTGTATYSGYDCGGGGGTIFNISGGNFTCKYQAAGPYTASVTVKKGGLTETAKTTIIVNPEYIPPDTPPTCGTGTWSPASPSWTNSSQTFYVSGVTVPIDGSGGTAPTGQGSCTVTTNGGTCTAEVPGYGGAITSCFPSPKAKIDKVPPTCIDPKLVYPNWTDYWYNFCLTAKTACYDDLSGCTSNFSSASACNNQTSYSFQLNDVAGNTSASCKTWTANIDWLAPICDYDTKKWKDIDDFGNVWVATWDKIPLKCTDSGGTAPNWYKSWASGCYETPFTNYDDDWTTKIFSIETKDAKPYVTDAVGRNGYCPNSLKFHDIEIRGMKTVSAGNFAARKEFNLQMRKNVASLTRGLQTSASCSSWINSNDSFDQLNKTLAYCKWDVTINALSITGWPKTLIVQNGNLKIAGNITADAKWILGIIVISDNNEAEVLIAPNVTDISAILFAEGTLLSAIDCVSDSAEWNTIASGKVRNAALVNQLYWKGSVVTYNTLGGKVNKICPMNNTTQQFVSNNCETDIYPFTPLEADLKYLRSYCPTCWGVESNDPQHSPYPTILEYDSRVLQTPPPWFELFGGINYQEIVR